MKKRQIVLPKTVCEQVNVQEGTPLRVATIRGSILLTPIRPPSASEYRRILKAAGRPLAKEPSGVSDRIKAILREVRSHGRRR